VDKTLAAVYPYAISPSLLRRPDDAVQVNVFDVDIGGLAVQMLAIGCATNGGIVAPTAVTAEDMYWAHEPGTDKL
jgi:hypothetical protein